MQPAPVTLGSMPQRQLTASEQSGSKRANGQLEVVFHFSSFTYDGRFANNAWLWETPDFLTKVTWDNYAMVSPETATTLGLENDTIITVKLGDRSIDLPCYTMPGQARYSIGLVLGGGRTEAGHVSTHPKNVADDQWKTDRVVGWDTDYVRGRSGGLLVRDQRDREGDRQALRAREHPGALEPVARRPEADGQRQRRVRRRGRAPRARS